MTKIILRDFVYLYTDGASRGNPGPASCAFVIRDKNNKLVAKKSKLLDDVTCNVAEYEGLIFGLQNLQALPFRGKIVVRSDSMLMVKQMSGDWKIKNEQLKSLADKARELLKPFKGCLFKHIYRRYNKEADALCNEAFKEEALKHFTPIKKDDLCDYDPVEYSFNPAMMSRAVHALLVNGKPVKHTFNRKTNVITITEK